MRITEIADAQAQLELWKLVNDSVWTAIQTQAQQQKRAEAERKAQAKLKPRVRKPTKAAPGTSTSKAGTSTSKAGTSTSKAGAGAGNSSSRLCLRRLCLHRSKNKEELDEWVKEDYKNKLEGYRRAGLFTNEMWDL